MPKRKKRNSIFKMAAGLAFAAFSGVVLLSGPPLMAKKHLRTRRPQSQVRVGLLERCGVVPYSIVEKAL